MNNKKIDAELYALLQSISTSEDGVTFVNKWDLPKQNEICEKIGLKTAKTYRSHLQQLIDCGYVVEDIENKRYILPNQEAIYLLLPLSTLQFLTDVMREYVIKLYIYLGQKWKNDLGREFTYEELGQHIGIKLAGNPRGYTTIKNALLVLSNCGLIKVSEEYFVDKGKSRHELLQWTTEYIKELNE